MQVVVRPAGRRRAGQGPAGSASQPRRRRRDGGRGRLLPRLGYFPSTPLPGRTFAPTSRTCVFFFAGGVPSLSTLPTTSSAASSPRRPPPCWARALGAADVRAEPPGSSQPPGDLDGRRGACPARSGRTELNLPSGTSQCLLSHVLLVLLSRKKLDGQVSKCKS